MSDERVVVETPCLHHELGPHVITEWVDGVKKVVDECTAGSRRTLTPGEYVLVEKVDGEWPEQLLDNLEGRLAAGVGEILDTLASVAGKDT